MNRRSVSRRIATVGLAEPLPQLTGLSESGSAESSYYTWVDQFNTLGLGENVPINTGNESEGLLALRDGEWVILRVPYPLGFYTPSGWTVASTTRMRAGREGDCGRRTARGRPSTSRPSFWRSRAVASPTAPQPMTAAVLSPVFSASSIAR